MKFLKIKCNKPHCKNVIFKKDAKTSYLCAKHERREKLKEIFSDIPDLDCWPNQKKRKKN